VPVINIYLEFIVRVIGNTQNPVWVKFKVSYVAGGRTYVYCWV